MTQDPAFTQTGRLELEQIDPATLNPDPRNPRTHSKRQIKQIVASIKEFGFVNPVLIDEGARVIAGHGRLEAANLLNLESVPAIRLPHLSEAQKRALVIADNKLAENAGWDETLLAQELRYLSEIEVDFDVEITGFEAAEIDLRIEGLEPTESDPKADEVPEPPSLADLTVAPGDLWRLGRHRLLCGDARDPACYGRLMAGEAAQMVFTDPPFNVPIDGHVCGLGSVKHRDFAMASGEMTEGQFTEFLRQTLSNLAAHSTDGSIHFVCIDWRHLEEALAAGKKVYSELKNLCVWNKTNAGMGSLYRSKHELVLVLKNGRAPHINNIELGRHGRYRSNVWDYAGVNTFGAERQDALAMHPTVKPVALVADAILDCSRRNGIILDPFAGSGTTLIAAERTGRRAYAMELDPGYVGTAIRRWQDYTGDEAVHGETGRTFAEIKAQRARGPGLDPTDLSAQGLPLGPADGRPPTDPADMVSPDDLDNRGSPASAADLEPPVGPNKSERSAASLDGGSRVDQGSETNPAHGRSLPEHADQDLPPDPCDQGLRGDPPDKGPPPDPAETGSPTDPTPVEAAHVR